MSDDYNDYVRTREEHYERFFGPLVEPVKHSTDMQVPHIAIYQFAPNDERPYWTLITGGMSDFRQPGIPEGLSPRAEILTYAAEPQNWMFNVLKNLAEMPFVADTFLHWWHTVPNGMPMTAEPSELTNFFFLPPYFEGPDFDTLKIDADDVDVLWMIPITDSELQYKLQHGAEALEELFERYAVSPVINESRTPLV